MQNSSHPSWSLLHAATQILRSKPSLLIPLAFSQLFKLILILLITTPLLKAYQYHNLDNGLVSYLAQIGIDLHGPMIYVALLLLFFINYCFTTLMHLLFFDHLLTYIGQRSEKEVFRLKLISMQFKSVLAWCIIDKSIGLFFRLVAPLLKQGLDDSPLAAYLNWSVISSLTVAMIADKNLSSLKALQYSQKVIHTNFGPNPRFTFSLLGPSLLILSPALLPFLIALSFEQTHIVWIGIGLSLSLWYFLSLIVSGLGLICATAFYQALVNNRKMKNFKKEQLLSLIKAS